MDHAPNHVLVPVHPDEPSASAMVTLLYVHDRRGKLEASAQLDAISNLHHIMMAPPGVDGIVPAFDDSRRAMALESLSGQWAELASMCPEGVQLRATWRQGAPLAESLAFIEEAGVDVVVVPAESACQGPAFRRLARTLPHSCSCQALTIFPPRPSTTKRRDSQGTRSLRALWKQVWRTREAVEPG
jgi:hypothetical protein